LLLYIKGGVNLELTNINQQDVIFALDIGTRSVIGTLGIVKDKKFVVIAESYVEHQERSMIDGQIHDISLVAAAVMQVKKELEGSTGIKLKNVAIAAAGRFLRTTVAKVEIDLDKNREVDKEVVRSIELTAVKKAEEQINKQTEGKLYCVGYSVKNYYLNEYVISNLLSHKGEKAGVEIIATFLPRSVVDSLYAVMDKVSLSVINMTLEPIAAMEAAIPQSLRLLNLALVDIGAGTSDIAISSKDSISAYGMVPIAGDEVTETIAQNYLVDFNTAEIIKRECSVKETLTYTDVLGFENEIGAEEIIKVVSPVVEKIAEEVSSRIIELNGGKAPNAVFLVGGGAHTPKLKEFISEKLSLPAQRLAIKGRDAVQDCLCLDNDLGSTGVTVLGIALTSIKKLGHDFIDVTLNGNVISLFNSHKHTVMDVMVQGGINPKILLGKNGKNIKFVLNDIKRVAFGTLATNAIVTINGLEASIDSEIKEGEDIQITYAKDGTDASPKIYEYVKKIDSISFYIDDIIRNMEPVALINGSRVELNENISNGDSVEIKYIETLGEYLKYFDNAEDVYKYYLKDTEISGDYIIKEGDRVYRVIQEKEIEQEKVLEDINYNVNEKIENNTQSLAEKADNKVIKAKLQEINNDMAVSVNGKNIILKDKNEYIFVDIFDYIDFDLTVAKGTLVLKLNNNKAAYYDKLQKGDEVEVYWE
jgi:cell division protein FtsA